MLHVTRPTLEGPPCVAHPASRLRETLARFPGRECMTVCSVGWGGLEPLEWLAARFARVVVLDSAPVALVDSRRTCLPAGVELRDGGADALVGLAAGADVVVAFDVLAPATPRELDRLLAGAHAALAEGGLFAFALPAAACIGGPVDLRLAGTRERRAFHEVELQYRLRRAAFGGMRIERIQAHGAGLDALVCTATRRAGN